MMERHKTEADPAVQKQELTQALRLVQMANMQAFDAVPEIAKLRSNALKVQQCANQFLDHLNQGSAITKADFTIDTFDPAIFFLPADRPIHIEADSSPSEVFAAILRYARELEQYLELRGQGMTAPEKTGRATYNEVLNDEEDETESISL